MLLTATRVAEELNVTPVTIGEWRKRGLLVPVYTTPTNRHFYSEEQIAEYKRTHFRTDAERIES